jgi:arsenate reductase
MNQALARKATRKATASSAGIMPVGDVNPLAVKVVEETGILMENQKPKVLTSEIVEEFDLIIAMGCIDACPYTLCKTIEWNIQDSKDGY